MQLTARLPSLGGLAKSKSQLPSARLVRCSCAAPNKPVFSLHPDLPLPKLGVIEDAMETCSVAASPEERRQCFETFGLDCENVDRYYKPVYAMEDMIHRDDNVGYSVVSSGGAALMWLVAICLLK